MKKKILLFLAMAFVLALMLSVAIFAAPQHYCSYEVVLNDDTRVTAYTVGIDDRGNGRFSLREATYTEAPVDSEGTYAALDWSRVKEIDFTNTAMFYYDSKKAEYIETAGGTNNNAKNRVCIKKGWSDASTFASVKKVNTGNAWSFSGAVFSGWTGIETVIISKNVETLADELFKNSSIANVVFEENSQVYRCNNNLFKNCDNLVRVEFPDSFTYLGDSGLFYDCDNLESVKWSVNCPAIPGGAFNGCEKLTFEIPDYITEIKSSAFNGCLSITSVVIPASVTAIGSDCWRNCKNLTSVIFEDGCSVSAIYAHTFDGCRFSEITLPNTVTQLRQNAFASNPNLRVVNLGAAFVDFNLQGNAAASLNCGSGLEVLYLSRNFTSAGVRADIFGDDNNANEWKKIAPNLVIFYEGDKNAAEAIIAASTVDGTVINGVFANMSAVSVAEYEALKAAGALLGRYIVYGYNHCDAFHKGEHKMAGELSMQFNGYFENVTFADACTRGNCGQSVIDESRTIGAMFTYLGYSYTELAINGTYSMSQFYGINKANIDLYTAATGNDFAYGFVMASIDNPLSNENRTENNVIVTGSDSFSFDYAGVRVFGITEEYLDNGVVFCIYILDGDNVSYLDNGITSNSVSCKSYNDIVALESAKAQ